MQKNVLIIGLGLIGSSLALCIKKEHPLVKITGIDIQEESVSFALKRGMRLEAAGALSSKKKMNASKTIDLGRTE